MAITNRNVVHFSGKKVMSLEEFKKWLKIFDEDKDGMISAEELKYAIEFTGGRFAGWKSRHAVLIADANRNGLVDATEVYKLVEFAQKQLGLHIVC